MLTKNKEHENKIHIIFHSLHWKKYFLNDNVNEYL